MKIEIIAELAQGFEGKPEQARLLLKAAATAGADAAKYQLVFADELATPDYKYYELFRSLEMGEEVWAALSKYAVELKISLHLDVFGLRSLRLAEDIGVTVVKLHGTDIANIGFLEKVAESGVSRVLLGAGGAHASEIKRAVEMLVGKEVVVLLGFQGYPTPTEANHVSRVRLLIQRLREIHPKVSIGFADHAAPDSPLRYALAATAVGAGATVLEKHLTLSRAMKLEDYESALNPDEFADFCKIVRDCSDANGSAEWSESFGMSEAERRYRSTIRRHVVTSRALSAGTCLSPSDVVLKRTGAGEAITDPSAAYGRTLRQAIPRNAPLKLTDVD